MAELRVLATGRHRLGVEETRLKNRLQAVLDLVWPELTAEPSPRTGAASAGAGAEAEPVDTEPVVVAFTDVDTPTVRAILGRWPLPEEFAATRFTVVESLVRRVSRNHISRERMIALGAKVRSSIGITTGRSARRSEILRLLERWTVLKGQIESLEARLSELVEAHPGARALTTVPGVSVVCAATLVAELGSPETFVSPRQVLNLVGMNLAKRHTSRGLPSTAVRSRPSAGGRS